MANIFTFMNQIYNKKKKVPFNKKDCSAYMLSLWLSHDKNLIDLVNKLNQYQFDISNISDELVYKYYFDKVPNGNRYIKWTKKEKNEKKDKQIENIMKEYSVSKRESGMILKHLEGIKNVKTKC